MQKEPKQVRDVTDAAWRARIRSRDKKIAELRARNDVLERERKYLDNESGSRAAELQALNRTLDQVRRDSRTYYDTLNKVQIQNDELRAKIAEQAAELRAMSRALEAMAMVLSGQVEVKRTK